MNIGIALLADRKVHNLARNITFDINNKYKTGNETALLPQHISLKQSFPYNDDINKIAVYIEGFCKTLKPFKVFIEKIEVNSFGGDNNVLAWLKVKECKELREIHVKLCNELKEKFGIIPIGFDGEKWKFHSTLAFSKLEKDSTDGLILEYNNKEICMDFEPKEIVMFCGVSHATKSSEYFSLKVFEIGK